ncbi:Flp pilus assembly protein CpaB [Zhihengliuella alba]
MLGSPARRPPSRRPRRYRRTWRDVSARYRRPAAAGMAALAVAAALAAVAPERAPTVETLVAAREIAAGQTIGADDVEPVQVARAALPPGHDLRAADAVGERVAIGIAAGTPLHAGLLVGDHLLTGMPPGTVAVPLEPANTEVLGLLSPGLHVDVVLSQGNGYEQPIESAPVARDVAVLWVPAEGGGGWMDASSGAGGTSTVVVAATADEAAELASAGSRGSIHLMLVTPEP